MYGDRQTDKLLIIYYSGSGYGPNYAWLCSLSHIELYFVGNINVDDYPSGIEVEAPINMDNALEMTDH